eukprot:GHVU01011999.1.p1 GENE.GHVU01011999.1~~GHVU01011999.1.p1  ORF type:complete len:181 (+),score=29.14 GHVU01011999.1:931-1473(+)
MTGKTTTPACGRVIGRASGPPRVLLLFGMVACCALLVAQPGEGFEQRRQPSRFDLKETRPLSEHKEKAVTPGLVTFAEAKILVFEAKKMPVRLFYREGCPYCARVRRFASEEGFDFDKFGVELVSTADQAGFKLLSKTTGGSTMVPALELDGGFVLQESKDIITLLNEILEAENPRREML